MSTRRVILLYGFPGNGKTTVGRALRSDYGSHLKTCEGLRPQRETRSCALLWTSGFPARPERSGKVGKFLASAVDELHGGRFDVRSVVGDGDEESSFPIQRPHFLVFGIRSGLLRRARVFASPNDQMLSLPLHGHRRPYL
jgi:hypothetical protein